MATAEMADRVVDRQYVTVYGRLREHLEAARPAVYGPTRGAEDLLRP